MSRAGLRERPPARSARVTPRRRIVVLVAGLALAAAGYFLGPRTLAVLSEATARGARDAGDLRSAEQAWARAVDLRPGHTPYRLALAEVRLERGDVRGASLAMGDPDSLDGDAGRRSAFARARIEAERGEPQRAVERLRRQVLAREGDGVGEGGPRSVSTSGLEIEALLVLARVLSRQLGQIDEADRMLRRAVERAETLPPGGCTGLDRALLERGLFAVEHGRLDAGESPSGLIEDAVELLGRGGCALHAARARAARAELRLRSADYLGAAGELERSARSLELLGDDGGRARAELGLGIAQVGLERHADAHSFYSRALRSFEALGSEPNRRSAERLLADLDLRSGRYEAARSRLARLLEDLPDTAERFKLLVTLGHTHLHLGEPALAADRYDQALRLHDRLGLRLEARRHRTFTMLGHASRQAGQLGRARRVLERSLLLTAARGDLPGLAGAHLALADLEHAEGDADAGLGHLERAVEIQARSLDTATVPFFLAQYQQALGRLWEMLFAPGIGVRQDPRVHSLLFRLLEQMRHRAFRGLPPRSGPRTSPGSIDSPPASTSEERVALAELAALTSSHPIPNGDSGSSAGAPGDAEEERFETLRHAYRRYEQAVLRSALASRGGDGEVAPRSRPARLEELRSALAPDTWVVLYAFGGVPVAGGAGKGSVEAGREHLFALLVGRDRVRAVTLGNRRGVEDRIRLLTARLGAAVAGDDAADSSWTDLAESLHAELIVPLEAAGLRRGSRLAVVPVGALFEVPFAALVRSAPEGPRYLVEDYVLGRAPTAAALLAAPRGGRGRAGVPFRPGGVLAVGVGEGVEGPALPLAEVEARWVGERLGGRTLLGARATEAALRAELRALARVSGAPAGRSGALGPGLLHLAVHGVAEPHLPLHSRLVLARPAASPIAAAAPITNADGRLTAREILELEAPFGLVVLSTCRSGASFAGRPDDWTGADRLGVAHAFLDAGAARVLTTLADLPDGPAFELVREVYDGLEVLPPADALARAQRAAVARGGPPHWAGFLLTGALP